MDAGAARKRLLARLDAIGVALERNEKALALIGLGSVGLETDRVDAYSDLDFFAIVEPGAKRAFLEDLSWLESAAPVAFRFKNTVDGYKALFADGIFCEFAVFEPEELSAIPFAPGRVVWRRDGVDDAIAVPSVPEPRLAPRTTEWLVGEALSNLYVGLGRVRRGEILAGGRLVQQHAVDRVVELAERLGDEGSPPNRSAPRDPFAAERRFEARHPGVAAALPRFVQGYDRTPESARAILAWLEAHFEVNTAMAEAVRGWARKRR